MRAAVWFLGFSLLFVVGAEGALAETGYVTNSSTITLRDAPGPKEKIVAMLQVDQPVEILSSQGAWRRVRVRGGDKDGLEGWIYEAFLVSRVPWKIRAEALEKENKDLRAGLTKAKAGWDACAKKEQELVQRVSGLSTAYEQLKKEYGQLKQGSAQFLEMREAYKRARSDLETLRKRAGTLTEENERLRASDRNRWFLTGAGVLCVGLILGLILGRQQKRRRSSYY